MLYNKTLNFTRYSYVQLRCANTYNLIEVLMNDIELKTLLGLKIKHYRNQIGLTQEELGEKIERTQRQVSLIELGSSFPNPETLTNMIKVFNCSMKDLFDFEPIENVENLKNEIATLVERLPEDKLKTLYLIGKNL